MIDLIDYSLLMAVELRSGRRVFHLHPFQTSLFCRVEDMACLSRDGSFPTLHQDRFLRLTKSELFYPENNNVDM